MQYNRSSVEKREISTPEFKRLMVYDILFANVVSFFIDEMSMLVDLSK